MEKGEAAWLVEIAAKVARLFAAEIAAHFEVETPVEINAIRREE